jgi:hypothetical protein
MPHVLSDENQRIVKGIESIMQLYVSQLLSDKRQFDAMRKEYLLAFDNWRHYVLAGVSFSAPLFVSLAQVETLKEAIAPLVVQLLIVILPIGLGSFFILSICKNCQREIAGPRVQVWLEFLPETFKISTPTW